MDKGCFSQNLKNKRRQKETFIANFHPAINGFDNIAIYGLEIAAQHLINELTRHK